LQDMWSKVPTQYIMDGPNEAHLVTVARNVLKDYQPHEGHWPTQYVPRLMDAAKQKFAGVLEADPDLAAQVEQRERNAYAVIS
jgi:acyl-CoA dehydrogenase